MRTIEEMRELFAIKGYNLLSTEYKGSKHPLVYEKDGYKYQNSYNAFIKTNNPKKWGESNPFSIHNIKLYITENNIPCKLISKEYNYLGMEFECSCGNVYTTTVSNFFSKEQYNCPECGRFRSAQGHIDNSYIDFLEQMKLKPIENYTGVKNPVYCKDENGYIIKIYPFNLRTSKNPRKLIERGIFNQYNKYWAYNYRNFIELNNYECQLLDEVPIKSHDNLTLKCSCGEVFTSNAQWFRKGITTQCQECSMTKTSSYEEKISNWLKENNITYEREKIFEKCCYKNPLRFDYYIPHLNLCIEADGEQHFGPVKFGGMTWERAVEQFKKNKKRDSIKNTFCKAQGVGLLRIPYTEFNNSNYIQILNSHILVKD